MRHLILIKFSDKFIDCIDNKRIMCRTVPVLSINNLCTEQQKGGCRNSFIGLVWFMVFNTTSYIGGKKNVLYFITRVLKKLFKLI